MGREREREIYIYTYIYIEMHIYTSTCMFGISHSYPMDPEFVVFASCSSHVFLEPELEENE